jgi:hypothetical protein
LLVMCNHKLIGEVRQPDTKSEDAFIIILTLMMFFKEHVIRDV